MDTLHHITVDDIVNQSHLRRWHQVRVNREQTLAEHQYLVAMLAAKMMQLGGAGPAVTAEVVMCSLVHDVHEVEMLGDLPAHPYAEKIAQEKLGQDVGDAMQNEFWHSRASVSFNHPAPNYAYAVKRMTKLADKLEAFFFYCLNGDPRTYPHRHIPEGMLDSVLRAFTKLDDNVCGHLHIQRSSIKTWLKKELQTWAGRASSTCGPDYETHVLNHIKDL